MGNYVTIAADSFCRQVLLKLCLIT